MYFWFHANRQGSSSVGFWTSSCKLRHLISSPAFVGFAMPLIFWNDAYRHLNHTRQPFRLPVYAKHTYLSVLLWLRHQSLAVHSSVAPSTLTSPRVCVCVCVCVCVLLWIDAIIIAQSEVSGVPRGVGLGVQIPPEIPKALQNRAKLNPIWKLLKIAEFRTPRIHKIGSQVIQFYVSYWCKQNLHVTPVRQNDFMFMYSMNVNTMGSQYVHSILRLNWQNRHEDDWSIAETCSLYNYLV